MANETAELRRIEMEEVAYVQGNIVRNIFYNLS